MDLQFILRAKRADDGKRFDLHFLVDDQSERCYGYVETPTSTELLFYAVPYGDGPPRWYLSLGAARDYLIGAAEEQHAKECAVLLKSVTPEETPEPQTKVKAE